jgi:integrase
MIASGEFLCAKGESMARRRYQRGQVFLRGKRCPVWIGRWREDVITQAGVVMRVRKSEVLGTRKDYATKRLALRALEDKLTSINDPSYKATPTITFREFSEKWKKVVLIQHDNSTQKADRSRLRVHLLPELGDMQLRDLNVQLLQGFVARCKGSAKSIKNMIALLRTIWNSAKSWGYVKHDPFDGLVLRKPEEKEQPMWTLEQVQSIMDSAEKPFDLCLWLLWETGIRRGEICALDVRHVDLANAVIVVRVSRSGSEIKCTKSRKPRVFSLSPQLVAALRVHVYGRSPDEPLFLSSEGKRLHPDNFAKRILKPIVEKLGLEGAFHAMRHGNATTLDELNTPLKVRQARLGHVDPATTLSYTHLVSEDDRRVSAQLGNLMTIRKRKQSAPVVLDPNGPNKAKRQVVGLP